MLQKPFGMTIVRIIKGSRDSLRAIDINLFTFWLINILGSAIVLYIHPDNWKLSVYTFVVP